MQMHKQIAARTMPVGNLTGLTDNERTELLVWLENGAPH
jgi:uncharacterized membrane protein